jgi:hypothetical protein
MSGYGKRTNAVYRWEDEHVMARDRVRIDPTTAQAVLTHAWQLCRLPGKPITVRYVPKDDPEYRGDVWASCGHGVMRIFKPPTTAVILHELCHALTDDPLDQLELRKPTEVDAHGPVWLSNYIWLLDRLMGPGYNTFYLRSTMPLELGPQVLPYYPTIWGKTRLDL